MSAYFDASLIVALFINDELNERAEALLRGVSPTIFISDFAGAEFSSALSRRVRMGMLTSRDARSALGQFDAWKESSADRLETTTGDIALADSYLRRLDMPLRTPDALNIAIAGRSAPLATFDRKMAECARTLGVAVVAT